MIDKVKRRGEIFTPEYLVRNMLDFVEYSNDSILNKHVIDNSCGEGAFLTEIVLRYCKKFLQKNSDINKLKNELEVFIHGIEIDENFAKKCRENLDEIARKFGIESVNWNIVNEDTLGVNQFDKKMDFVIGNPPYVRIHNLKKIHNKVKSFSFSGDGMTDLYIAFYEIGFKMLNNAGKLCYITPSSWLTSKSGAKLREFAFREKNLTKVIDLGHFQAFENATTYTFITCFDKNSRNNFVDYFVYDNEKKIPEFREKLDFGDILIDNKFYFAKNEDLEFLKDINSQTKNILLNRIEVKNGFATLADSIFIGDFDFRETIVIPIIKASTGKWTKVIFPYNKLGKPISKDIFREKFPESYNYLKENREILENRAIADKNSWFLFGRSQAIGDVFREKLAVNTTIKDLNSIKINEVPSGSGLYSGIYITGDFNKMKIEKYIKSEEFLRYVKNLKKYKSGGYYTFSTGDLRKFLLYKLKFLQNDNEIEGGIHEQQEIFGSIRELVSSLS